MMHLFTHLTETIKSDISSSDKLEYSGSILLGATSLTDTHPLLYFVVYTSLNPLSNVNPRTKTWPGRTGFIFTKANDFSYKCKLTFQKWAYIYKVDWFLHSWFEKYLTRRDLNSAEKSSFVHSNIKKYLKR